jgi:hypothetical protein
MTLTEKLDQIKDRKNQGPWIPACGGTETPFKTRNGFILLYCWQPATGKHAYLNVETDIILSNEQAELAMGLK